MNKGAIQRFAIWARNELIAQVSQRAYQYGITKEGYGEANAVTVGGRALTGDEQKQRKELVDQIRSKGYTQVMEEVAYTWFNRFIALRFMEVNNYLPSHIRVFSDSTGAFKPEILSDVLHLDLPGLNREKVAEYIESNDTEGLYRYLLLTQCNALNAPLPRMFEKMGGYTELLLPNNILKQDSVLGHMVADIPEEDWTDQVQIIGWLYQFYNTELKAEVFGKNGKITKNEIPAATQLFTPDWIVRYMVENSLGRIYVDKRKNEGVYADGRGLDEMTWSEAESERIATEKLIADKMGWKYYLPEAEQTQDVRKQLDEIQAEYANLDVKDIKVIDPCMGSGHILVYAFDVLMQIYEANGVSQRDAAQSILENNLYGLDIDDRAAQLAYFAVMMKARQYDRRIFSRGIQPHVYAIVESNGLDSSSVDYFTNNDPKLKKDFGTLMDELRDAKEYGSILNISQVDFAALYARMEEVQDDISIFREIVMNSILPLIQVAEVMSQKYDAVITNPPYMAVSNADTKVNDYVKKNFPDSKADMFAVFMERCGQMAKKNGYQAMITQHSWMFLSSFEKLRTKLLAVDIINMAHLGARAFEEIGGEVVQTTTFVIQKSFVKKYSGSYCRLITPTTQQGKEDMFLAGNNQFVARQDEYKQIPGSPIAYWISEAMRNCYSEGISFPGETKKGVLTGNDALFVRFWHEVSVSKIGFSCGSHADMMRSNKKWFPKTGGGAYRKWYGNIEDIVNLENDGAKIKATVPNYRLRDPIYYMREALTWTEVAGGHFSSRYVPSGVLFGNGGPVCFFQKNLLYTLGLLNSKVAISFLQAIAPTLNFGPEQINRVPFLLDNECKVEDIVRTNIAISKTDWDSFETSWDFTQHPLVEYKHSVSKVNAANSWYIKNAFEAREYQCQLHFNTLKTNEEELNRIFIDTYGLQDELTPEVADKDVTVHRVFDSKDEVPESMKGSNYVRTMRDEIVSLISYAVGCMFGRYSLDKPGLVFAGYSKIECSTKTLDGDDPELEKFAKQNADGSISYSSYYHEINQDNYTSFPIDTDNIIPICDDDYFDDDITGRFVKWVETVYGKETLEENLKFISDALGGKGMPREVIRSYFLNDFYADHVKTYQKRPIYWLFDSGKKNGFKALIYMHRYQSDLLARMRTDYVHEQQERYRTQLTHLTDAIEHAGAAERVKLTKQQKKLQEQALEIQKYEEKIHHLADQNIQIDLDDGVKHNYELFADVLAKIK